MSAVSAHNVFPPDPALLSQIVAIERRVGLETRRWLSRRVVDYAHRLLLSKGCDVLSKHADQDAFPIFDVAAISRVLDVQLQGDTGWCSTAAFNCRHALVAALDAAGKGRLLFAARNLSDAYA